MANRGFGAAIQKQVSSNAMAHLTYSRLKQFNDGSSLPNSIKSDSSDLEHKIEQFGARLDYFPISNNLNGWYIAGALAQINLKSDVQSPSYPQYSFSAKDDQLGVQAYSGYQFKLAQILARIGAGYGLGGAYEVDEVAKTTEIKNGILLDAGVTILF